MIIPKVRVEASQLLAELRAFGERGVRRFTSEIVNTTGRELVRAVRRIAPRLSGALVRSMSVRSAKRRQIKPGFKQVVVYPNPKFRIAFKSPWGTPRVHRPVAYYQLVDVGARPHQIVVVTRRGAKERAITIAHPGARAQNISARAAQEVQPRLREITRAAVEKALAKLKKK
ncbi:MAG: hypothetical protein QXW98_03635 [Candidatus Caldarchaeum sp.]